MIQLLRFSATLVFFYFSLFFCSEWKQTLHCPSSVTRQNIPAGQCDSFMARWMENVRGKLFWLGQGRTLTQSLALPQERRAHLETEPKHERNHIAARHSYRKTWVCLQFCVYLVTWNVCSGLWAHFYISTFLMLDNIITFIHAVHSFNNNNNQYFLICFLPMWESFQLLSLPFYCLHSFFCFLPKLSSLPVPSQATTHCELFAESFFE